MDSMVAATVEDNLATSSGYMGSEAISRSTRLDRRRDPLYNQLKMYAELYRALGWIHPTAKSSLNFTITLVGHQIAIAKQHYNPLLGETVLGISHPSHILKIKGDYNTRPFAFILKTMLETNFALSRDEMIVGPLSVNADLTQDAIPNVVELIRSIRESRDHIAAEMTRVAEDSSVQINTLKNYTRWPIAIMRDLGWTVKSIRFFQTDKTPFEVHELTELGREVAKRVSNSYDVRLDLIDTLPYEEKAAIAIDAHYRMLERTGFDLTSVYTSLELNEPALGRARTRIKVPAELPLLFSPFQSLSIGDIERIFPSSKSLFSEPVNKVRVNKTVVGRGTRDHLFVKPIWVPGSDENQDPLSSNLKEELQDYKYKYSTEKETAAAFAQSRVSDNQTQFYPLISSLFNLSGFGSDISRSGVNYQRWDGWVDLDGIKVPMEIKSPTEESTLSTKAIRQALENKIILLARGGLNTSSDSTTLIVGYKVPNERGEMSTLIDDIFEAFDIRIGVIELEVLVLLALRTITDNVAVDTDQLRALRGFLHV
ncbi:MAG: hypothetical protein OXO51_12430 [Gemmatimonadota bacterium]|nr:hypothetical protein [Gemmatimonadota bacterium]